MRSDELKTIGFAAIVCVSCSLVLASARAMLRDRIADNLENDRKLNVLRAFRPDTLPDGKALSEAEFKHLFDDGNLPPEMIAAYFQQIEEVFVSRDGTLLEGKTRADFDVKALEDKKQDPMPLYKWRQDGEVIKYAFPMYGKGLWSTVHSYMALEKDLNTIAGVTFYGHAETPGLGGECSKPWFQHNFVGKKMLEDGRPARFEVLKGKVADIYGDNAKAAHAVDGMSGATLTGKGIQNFINSDFQLYNAYFNKIRGS